MVRFCMLICAAFPLWGGTLGNVDSRPNPLLALDAPPADYSFRDFSPAEWRPCTFETCTELTLSAGPLQLQASQDSYNLGRDAEASPKNSVALGITALLIAFFLRKHFLEHGNCREYEDLREHLLIASRSLALLRTGRSNVPEASQDLGFCEAQLNLLESAWNDRRRGRQLDVREHEDLGEHLAIASRHLDFAREAAPFTGRAYAMHEVRVRQRNIDALAAAITRCRETSRSRGQLRLREREDLREHLLLGRRHLTAARQAGSLSACEAALAAMEREVAMLTAAIASHCQTHQCQSGSDYRTGYYAAQQESA